MTKTEPTIDITKEFVKEKFKEYNELYFNGELKMPKITLIDGTKYAGTFTCRHNKTTGKLYEQEIGIAYNVLWNIKTFENTLVHEMIHYYVNTKEVNPLKGDFQHCGLFWKMKIKLNWKYGLHIKNRDTHLKLKNED
ncbi:MAG: SprT-like domain-containing protein [Paludibacteraceae bacterium]